MEAESDLIASLSPGDQVFIGPESAPHEIENLRPHRRRYLLSLKGCRTRNEAEAFRALEVKLRFDEVEALPEGTYYHWQILGLEVLTEEGRTLGEIQQIIETGANDVYVVRDQEGREFLLPAIESVIREVDLRAGRVTVHLLPGLGGE